MGKPFFSVVLPTRNRAGFLPFAIRSILSQTFGDFELIVSNNDSADNTEEIVRAIDDPRLRYIKTERALSLYEHWEFALEHAVGEYVTFLGDDDAHSKIYLESIEKIITENAAKMISCKMADYYYGGANGTKRRLYSESLVSDLFTNKLFVYDSKERIKDLFIDRRLVPGEISRRVEIPQLINTVYHRSVFDRVRENIGSVFPKILSVDYYLAVVTLNFTESYYYLDSPLAFHGISSESTTSSITRQTRGKTLKDTQPELAVFQKVPMELLTPYNFTVDAVLLAKSHLDGYLDYVNVDMTGYFVEIFRQLHALELNGIDISEETKEYASLVKKQDPERQKELERLVLNRKTRFINLLRRDIHRAHLRAPLARLRRWLTSPKNIVLEGKLNGFSNIIECAEIVDNNFLLKYADRQ